MAERLASRDREARTARLIDAVGRVLARDGFGGLGVNAVAKEAGVDKVLIYRYFGGLPELLRAFGERGDFWPTDHEIIGPDPDALLALDPGERWAILWRNFARALRSRPMTREILAWDAVESNELTAVLEELRETQFERLLARFGHDIEPDGPIATGVVVAAAATNYLLIRSRDIRTFAGADLHDDATWDRIDEVIATTLHRFEPNS